MNKITMFERINFTYFIISFCLGIFVVYTTKQPVQVVHKFPSPTNLATKYRDNTNSCYKYEYEEVQCDGNQLPQPIIEDFKKKI